MKEAKRSEVERFLNQQGYKSKGGNGRHEKFAKPGSESVPLPRHNRISPGVLRDIEKIVGFVPDKWK